MLDFIRLHGIALTLSCFSLLLASTGRAQINNLNLRGGRFKPLTAEELTPQQRALVDHIMSGERASMDGPFNVLLRSPELGDAAQKLGARIRFHSSLPGKLNEFAILITGRYWNAQFEFFAHRKLAIAAGLAPAVVDALAAGKTPPAMDADERAVFHFSTELLNTHRVSDKSFNAVRGRFGERAAVDLIGVLGYYCLVSMILNVDQYPLPPGAPPPLQPARPR